MDIDAFIREFEENVNIRLKNKNMPELIVKQANPSPSVPNASLFFLGLCFGVVASRVACTYINLKHENSNMRD